MGNAAIPPAPVQAGAPQPPTQTDLVDAVKGGVQNLAQLTQQFTALSTAISNASANSITSISGGSTGLTASVSSHIATLGGTLVAGSGGTGVTSITALTALLNLFTSSLQGVVPASGGGTSNFLRADGTWAAPGSGGRLLNVRVFTATASYFPTAGANSGLVMCIGAGGGAAGLGATATGGGALLYLSAGAGSGSTSWHYISSGISSQTVTIGAGGAAGNPGAGGNGGDASFGSLCIGKGGSGAPAFLASSGSPVGILGGLGGVSGTGNIWTPAGNDGGNSAFINALNIFIPGSGAPSSLGGGVRPGFVSVAGNSAAQAARAGGNYGAGATSGSGYDDGTHNVPAITGAAGGQGICVVFEFS